MNQSGIDCIKHFHHKYNSVSLTKQILDKTIVFTELVYELQLNLMCLIQNSIFLLPLGIYIILIPLK